MPARARVAFCTSPGRSESFGPWLYMIDVGQNAHAAFIIGFKRAASLAANTDRSRWSRPSPTSADYLTGVGRPRGSAAHQQHITSVTSGALVGKLRARVHRLCLRPVAHGAGSYRSRTRPLPTRGRCRARSARGHDLTADDHPVGLYSTSKRHDASSTPWTTRTQPRTVSRSLALRGGTRPGRRMHSP